MIKKKTGSYSTDTIAILRRWCNRKTRNRRGESDARDPDSWKDRSRGENSAAAGPQLDTESRPELPRLAELKDLFRRPEFSIPDGLNDYDRDYTGFVPLGGILTHEFKRSLARAMADRKPEPGQAVEIAAEDRGRPESEDAPAPDNDSGTGDDPENVPRA